MIPGYLVDAAMMVKPILWVSLPFLVIGVGILLLVRTNENGQSK